MLHISARLVLPSARGAGFHDRLLFHGSVTENIHRRFEFISYSCHVKITERRRHTASTRSKCGHPMFVRSVCQLRAEQMTHTTCWVLIRRVSQWTKPFSSRNIVLFLQYPVFSSMTRSAHCNRIFARSLDCSGVVSHAMHCVLIGASAIQHAETVLVGLAPRCQDANATRNIPHVGRTTEAVAASMLKRALVNKLNAPASMSEILHRAKAFLITDFQAVHFFGSLPTFFRVWERFASGRSSLEVVYSSSAESELLGRWRLPSGVKAWRSPRGTSMSRCQQSEFSPFCRGCFATTFALRNTGLQHCL